MSARLQAKKRLAANRKAASVIADKHADFRGSLKALRILDKRGPLAQSNIAHDLGVSPPAALSHFRKLDKEGLVVAVDKKVTPGRGRPLELWDVDRSRNFTIGVIVSPPVLVVALADFANNIVLQQQHEVDTAGDPSEVESILRAFTEDALAHLKKSGHKLRAACACVSGPANMPALAHLDFDGLFAEYDIPCLTAALSAAAVFGEAKRFDFNTTVCVVDWDFGVGVMPCCSDRVLFFDDTEFSAIDARRKLCDFGHQRIVKNGRECHCGQRGCLEAYAGGRAIIETLNRPDIRDFDDLRKGAQKGDAEVLRELALAAHYMGSALSQFVLLIGIDKIVITGPLSDIFPLVRADFNAGLEDYLDIEEIQALESSASPDPLGLMVMGSCRAARHFFLHSDLPGDLGLLSKTVLADY
ncbi:MAG: ROK family protein [Sedimentisphaerales bacterium]|nr:ROK family protein [Sedimentisphaerales bacterium]